ncbi:hypothetical protein HDU67_007452 [Dinochytrium kinnereticum]|nr:hypothetical protein HDU67_007452 [Dinochytrium kinnereticum]
MVFRFILKVGIIAYALDWLHKRANEHRRPSEFDRRIEDITRNVHEESNKLSAEFTPRVREWLHKAFSHCEDSRHRGFRWESKNTWHSQPQVTELPGGRRMSVEVDVPGIHKEDIVVSVVEEERAILVKGKAEANAELGKGERSVETRVYMPRKTDMSDVRASYENGVLRVEAGKKDYEGRKIPIG